MEPLTDEQTKEIEALLRKRCKKYSEKAIAGVVKTLNQLRKNEIQLTDFLVPELKLSYEDWVLDTGLENYLKPK